MGCRLPDSSVHGIFQARILEWVAISFSRGLSQHRDQTRSPALRANPLPSEPAGKPLHVYMKWINLWHRSIAFPGGWAAKNPLDKQETQEMRVWSLGQKIPWRKKWQPTPVFLPGESHRQRGAWRATVHGVTESDTTEHVCAHGKIWLKTYRWG